MRFKALVTITIISEALGSVIGANAVIDFNNITPRRNTPVQLQGISCLNTILDPEVQNDRLPFIPGQVMFTLA